MWDVHLVTLLRGADFQNTRPPPYPHSPNDVDGSHEHSALCFAHAVGVFSERRHLARAEVLEHQSHPVRFWTPRADFSFLWTEQASQCL